MPVFAKIKRWNKLISRKSEVSEKSLKYLHCEKNPSIHEIISNSCCFTHKNMDSQFSRDFSLLTKFLQTQMLLMATTYWRNFERLHFLWTDMEQVNFLVEIFSYLLGGVKEFGHARLTDSLFDIETRKLGLTKTVSTLMTKTWNFCLTKIFKIVTFAYKKWQKMIHLNSFSLKFTKSWIFAVKTW